jgi:hypothetical protein
MTAFSEITTPEELPPRGRQVVEFFNAVRYDTMHLVDDFYAEDVEFHDPAGTLKGNDQVKLYYKAMYKNVVDIKFDFPAVLATDDVVMAEWVMTVKMKSFNGGKPIVVPGMSHIRFNEEGKAIYHRDSFDLGAMVYEKIPLFGGIVRWLRKRLAKH